MLPPSGCKLFDSHGLLIQTAGCIIFVVWGEVSGIRGSLGVNIHEVVGQYHRTKNGP